MALASCNVMTRPKIGLTYTNHLRAWREYRSLTQEQLGELVGTSGSVISLLEASKRQLTSRWLNKLAVALHTTPGFILDQDPRKIPVDLLDIWEDIPEDRRLQALAVLRTFARPDVEP